MFVTFPVSNKGTVLKLQQLLNIPLMFVTFAVLNKATVVRLKQLENMLDVSVTAEVFVSLLIETICNELQSENIVLIVLNEPDVLPISHLCILCIPLTMLPKFVILPVFIKFTYLANLGKTVPAGEPLPIVRAVKLGPEIYNSAIGVA
jgi:hypothetical protein